MYNEEKPWQKPDEETRAAAEPIEKELEKALAHIDTPEKALALVDELLKETAEKTADDVDVDVDKDAPAPDQVKMAADVIKAACDSASGDVDEAMAVIEAAAREAATLEGEPYEAIAEAIQEVTNPELQGHPEKLARPRRYLLDAVLRHPGISLAAKIDTRLFVLINVYTPRTKRIDSFFSRLSAIFTGGWIYMIFVALAFPFRPQQTWALLKRISLPTIAAALVVEGPIKMYFRRRRPFIDIVRAIIVGKKPGNWSFPSGHASAAFGGAYITAKYIPWLRPIVYPIATLVAYSRIYLGAHYPFDVITGSAIGVTLAAITDRLARRYWLKDEKFNAKRQRGKDAKGR
ncbi:MAG: phosphatase PAP2 family protein [Caldilineaceae bacterium]|nr:phosphatase PAP2 family protein [Caldilineaceae bacterium]